MRSDWIGHDDLGHVLALLMPENRLAMEVALHTGLRIGDVLALKSDKLKQKMSVKEAKTDKSRRVSLSKPLYDRLRLNAGSMYVFPGARSQERHRTRQAVWADMKRAARALRIKENVSPHSARKVYAVDLFKQSGDIELAQRLLNHDNQTVTAMYVLADQLALRRKAPNGRKRSSRPPT